MLKYMDIDKVKNNLLLTEYLYDGRKTEMFIKKKKRHEFISLSLCLKCLLLQVLKWFTFFQAIEF